MTSSIRPRAQAVAMHGCSCGVLRVAVMVMSMEHRQLADDSCLVLVAHGDNSHLVM